MSALPPDPADDSVLAVPEFPYERPALTIRSHEQDDRLRIEGILRASGK